MMNRISTAWRMSFGLALLTISVVFAADFVGLIPDPSGAVLEGRKQLCESLAIQSAVCLERNDLAAVQATMQLVADRNDDIISASLHTVDGKLLALTSDYVEGPTGNSEKESVPTRVLVPIFMGDKRWATMKVCFCEVMPGGIERLWTGPTVRMVIFVGLVGFMAYLWFLKRTLRYLDPNSVVPKRVKTALDTLVEGVVLLDKDERIVLANSAFARNVGHPEASLLGQKAACLNWRSTATDQTPDVLPWTAALRDGQAQTAVPLEFTGRSDDIRKLMVNAAVICDEHNDKRGAIATFDDITKFEEQSMQLQEMLHLWADFSGLVDQYSENPEVSVETPNSTNSNEKSITPDSVFTSSTVQRQRSELSLGQVQPCRQAAKKTNGRDTARSMDGEMAPEEQVRPCWQTAKKTNDSDTARSMDGEMAPEEQVQPCWQTAKKTNGKDTARSMDGEMAPEEQVQPCRQAAKKANGRDTTRSMDGKIAPDKPGL